jgi:hypothetical protein
MVTTVLRRTYTAPCRWYLNGTPQTIRFYFARTGAMVFPLKTIFWGRDRVKQIANSTGPGEITVPVVRNFFKGPGISTAPGIGYTGTQADFLGQSSVLWSPETPTPSWLLPLCDAPPAGSPGYWQSDYWSNFWCPQYWP